MVRSIVWNSALDTTRIFRRPDDGEPLIATRLRPHIEASPQTAESTSNVDAHVVGHTAERGGKLGGKERSALSADWCGLKNRSGRKGSDKSAERWAICESKVREDETSGA